MHVSLDILAQKRHPKQRHYRTEAERKAAEVERRKDEVRRVASFLAQLLMPLVPLFSLPALTEHWCVFSLFSSSTLFRPSSHRLACCFSPSPSPTQVCEEGRERPHRYVEARYSSHHRRWKYRACARRPRKPLDLVQAYRYSFGASLASLLPSPGSSC